MQTIATTHPVNSEQDQDATSREESQANIVDLADKLPLGLLVCAVLCLERRRLIEEEQHD